MVISSTVHAIDSGCQAGEHPPRVRVKSTYGAHGAVKNTDYSPRPNNCTRSKHKKTEDTQIQPLARFGSIYRPEALRFTEMNWRMFIACGSAPAPAPPPLFAPADTLRPMKPSNTLFPIFENARMSGQSFRECHVHLSPYQQILGESCPRSTCSSPAPRCRKTQRRPPLCRQHRPGERICPAFPRLSCIETTLCYTRQKHRRGSGTLEQCCSLYHPQ